MPGWRPTSSAASRAASGSRSSPRRWRPTVIRSARRASSARPRPRCTRRPGSSRPARVSGSVATSCCARSAPAAWAWWSRPTIRSSIDRSRSSWSAPTCGVTPRIRRARSSAARPRRWPGSITPTSSPSTMSAPTRASCSWRCSSCPARPSTRGSSARAAGARSSRPASGPAVGWPRRIAPGWSTSTSSRPTCSSMARARRGSPTSASRNKWRAPDVSLRRTRRSGAIVGTPAYMALEQHRGSAADARADQFAFAVTVFEALFGQRPYPGTSKAAIAVAIEAGRIAPVDRRGVPRRIHAALCRALAAEPGARFATLEALLDELAPRPRVGSPARHRRRDRRRGARRDRGGGAERGRQPGRARALGRRHALRRAARRRRRRRRGG